MTSPKRIPGSIKKQLLSSRNFIAGLAIFLCLVLLFSGALQSACYAQQISGSILGTVTDSRGAVVPGATVTVTDMGTNISHTEKTSHNGEYDVTHLQPGHYSVTVGKDGFQTYQQTNVILTTGLNSQVNATLPPGSRSQRVVVAAIAPALQTQNPSVGLTLNAATIVNTPLNGRLSIAGLLALAPGVQSATAQDQVPYGGVSASIGQGAEASGYGGTGYTLDGAVNEEVTLERGEGEVPPPDGIAEVRIITAGGSAQYTEPAQIIVVSKSGTNQYHGMLLEFNRITGTAAKSFFAGSLPQPTYHRNEFGGNFSGPVVIPKIYNGRDRTFFFFNFEQFILNQAQTDSTTMPTVAERAGNFVGVPNNSGGTGFNAKYQAIYPLGVIPSTAFNPVDVQLQNILFPLPTTSGVGVVNTIQNVPYVAYARHYALRVDEKLTDRDQLRGSFLRTLYGPNATAGTTSNFGGFSQIGEINMNTIVGWTHTFSPTLVLDTGGAYLHLPIFRTPENSNQNFGAIIPGLVATDSGPVTIEGAPTLGINGIQGVSEAGSHDFEQDIQAFTTLTKVLQTHTIEAGFTFLRNNHWEDGANQPPRGSYQFTGQYTGIGYADFLLGDAATTERPIPNDNITRNLSNEYGAFVQDNWRATPRLTLNGGIRYDLQSPRDNPYHTNALFLPTLHGQPFGKVVVFEKSIDPPANGPTRAIPGLLQNFGQYITLASQVGLPTQMWHYLGIDRNNFAPRVGLDYQLQPNKTVLHAAFGIYYELIPFQYPDLPENIPYYTNEQYVATAGTPISMNAPFANIGVFGANPGATGEHSPTNPYTEQYNMDIEHEFPKGITARVGYVGQHNVKQINGYGAGPDLNYPPNGKPVLQVNRPYQPFGSVVNQDDPIFHSSFNALQVGVHKQYSRGLMINAEYGWSRALGTENFQSPYNVNDSYGNLGNITPQTLSVSYSYLFPFGRGQWLLSNANKVVNTIISGWQLSGITQWYTGQPFSVSSSQIVAGGVIGRAHRIPGVPLYPKKQTLQEWFNPAAFSPPTFTFGNSGYNMLWGPHYQDWDASLQKTFTWSRKYHFQFRADAFNAFNHPNFQVPNSNISNVGQAGTITSLAGGAENRTLEFAGKLFF